MKARIRALGAELGFDAIGFSRAEVPDAARAGLAAWLAAGRHGGMDYMARHADLRGAPAALLPGAVSVIAARLSYWPEPGTGATERVLADSRRAYVSRYALGRDYHKTLRLRLARLAERLAVDVGKDSRADAMPACAGGGPPRFRACVDSAPVMEVELAAQAGLGWRGKHTLLLTRQGSWHFLGEILTDLPIEPDAPAGDHCGACTACLDICPTRAIVAPRELDASRCISYLTIEHFGPIPEGLRSLIGNRIYGCDDCQLVCPWNRFATPTREADFAPRNGLDAASLVELFAWSEADFATRLAGSPIRRIGHERWLRNIAIALGNAPSSAEIRVALASRSGHPSPLVREHVAWARSRHGM